MELNIIIILIILMYFISGLQKSTNFDNVVKGLKSRLGINMPYYIYQMIILLVIILEILGPLFIVKGSFDRNYKEIGIYSAYGLVIFTILATLIYHFPPFGNTYYAFISNITSIGALLLVAYVLKNDKRILK